jgi:hypothetical protein
MGLREGARPLEKSERKKSSTAHALEISFLKILLLFLMWPFCCVILLRFMLNYIRIFHRSSTKKEKENRRFTVFGSAEHSSSSLYDFVSCSAITFLCFLLFFMIFARPPFSGRSVVEAIYLKLPPRCVRR